MLVYKHRGFVSPDLNETLGIKKVEMRSTGRNNSGTAYIQLEGSVIRTETQRGLTIVTMNEDWTVDNVNRFDVYGSSSARSDLANFIRNRPSNKIFFIITFDSLRTDPDMSAALASFGAIRFNEIPFDSSYNNLDGYEYNTRIPYCAIAGSEVGIIYESLGSGIKNASYPHAQLNVMLPELKYFGCQGFGRNLSDLDNFEGNTYRYFLVRPMEEPANQYYKFSYFYKVVNQDNSMSHGAWVRIDLVNHDDDVILDTVYNRYITSKQWCKHEGYLPPLENGNKYRGSIVVDGATSNVKMDRIRIVKAGTHHPYYDDNHFGRVTDEYPSALHLRTSNFGPEPYYGDAIEGGYITSTQLFNDDLNIPVYEYNNVKGKYINDVYDSELVEVKDTDVGIIGNCVLYGESGNYQPKLTTTFYDDSMNVIDTMLHIDHTQDVPQDENVFLEWYIFKEDDIPNYANYARIQNIRYLPAIEDYGYSSNPQVNAVLAMPPNTKYIRYEFDKNTYNNYYVAYPCANTIVPMAGRNGFISPANFNMEPPKPPPATALVFENTLFTSFYTVDVGAPTPENIVAEWPRASNTTYWDDPSNATGQSADWFYDASANSFSNPNNSGSYIQLLSPDKSNAFEFESVVTSPSGDNDSIGLVAAANDSGSDFETIIVACNAGHIGPAKGFSLYLMSTISGNQVLAQSMPFSSTGQGWSGRTLRVRVIRDGNTITAQASNWNSNTLDESQELTVDLSTLTGTILTQPSRYGFFSFSQSNAQFLQYQVSGGGVYDRRTIYDGETLDTWYFNNSNSWVKTGGKLTDDITPPREVYNPSTRKTYNVSYGGTTLTENEGIVGSTPTLNVTMNTTTTYPVSDITTMYSYGMHTLTIKSVTESVNCSITFNDNDFNLTTTGDDGHFYLYLEADDGTIGFVKYNVVVS